MHIKLYNKCVNNDCLYKQFIVHPEKIVIALRKELKISQDELSKLLDVTNYTIYRWEKKKSTPTAFNMRKILNIIKDYKVKARNIK